MRFHLKMEVYSSICSISRSGSRLCYGFCMPKNEPAPITRLQTTKRKTVGPHNFRGIVTVFYGSETDAKESHATSASMIVDDGNGTPDDDCDDSTNVFELSAYEIVSEISRKPKMDNRA